VNVNNDIERLNDVRDALLAEKELIIELVDDLIDEYNDMVDDHNELVDQLIIVESALAAIKSNEVQGLDRIITLCHTGK
jgi:predicted nucleic-acid-binding protein